MPYIKRQHSAKGEKKAGGDEREEGEHDPAEYPESSDEEDPDEDKRWTEIDVATLPVHDDTKEDWQPDVKSTQLKTGPRGIDMDDSKRGIFLKWKRQGTIEQIVAQTTNYAQQHERSNWTPTTVDEMWAFIGCVLLIGTKHMERQEVWLEWPFGDDFIKRVFYERRFVDLLACFHMVDNETTTACLRNGPLVARGGCCWCSRACAVRYRYMRLEHAGTLGVRREVDGSILGGCSMLGVRSA